MRLSFDDKESFKVTTGSLRFNHPQSDPNTCLQMESSSMPPPGQPEGEERKSEDIIDTVYHFDHHDESASNA